MSNKIDFNIKKLKAKDIKFDPFWIETVDRTRVNAYSDTDSVLGNSIIRTKDRVDEVQKIYNDLNEKEFVAQDLKGYPVQAKKPQNLFILSFNINSFKPEYKKVKTIWKYKTTKKIYQLKIKNKTILCTEDHSIIIERNKKIEKIKLKELQSTDKIIYIE